MEKDPADPAPELVQAIDRWLPQTQCTQCGYPRCRDYAVALAAGDTDLNRCPPGGEATIRGLATLLDRPVKALNPDCGEHKPRTVARIDEARCIGCTLCIEACPVDAIAGAAKRMHTVIESECTGCELCLAPCPVDCIDMLPAARRGPAPGSPWRDYSEAETDLARRRTEARLARLDRRHRERRLDGLHKRARTGGHSRRIRSDIAAAVTRVRARRRPGRDAGRD